jgi:hypothetical protein
VAPGPSIIKRQTPGHALKLPHATNLSTLVIMPSLLLVVFVLQLALHLINTVGASTVDELVRTFPYATVGVAYTDI